MNINLIVANSQNGVIGKDNHLPWDNSEDLKRFKNFTQNSYVIMGRKTFDSIGKPLDGRINLVLSKTKNKIPGARVFGRFEDVIVWLGNQEIAFPKVSLKAFVIGGEEIYKQFLDKDRIVKIYQTVIKSNVDGDAFFDFDKDKWETSSKEINEKEDFLIWTKKKD